MLDQLGQGSALVVVTGYCSEEGWVLGFVTETSTGGKVADLKKKVEKKEMKVLVKFKAFTQEHLLLAAGKKYRMIIIFSQM